MSKKHLLAAVAAVVVAFVAWRLFVAHRSNDAFARLRARGLPTSPAELDRWYKAVPPALNLATPIAEATAGFRAPAATNTPYLGRHRVPPPPFPVDPALLATWKKSVDDAKEAFSALEVARGRTDSRYPIQLGNGFNTLMPHLASLKGLAQFLALATLTHAESGQPREAVRDVEDILLVARSLESEPLLISQLVRISLLEIGAGAAATSLPRAAVDDADWKRLQEAFARAESANPFHRGIAGEAAMAGGFFDSGPSQLATGLIGSSAAANQAPASAKLAAALYVGTGLRAVDGNFCMERLVELVDASQRPFPEALALARASEERVDREMARPLKGLKIMSGMLLPALGRSTEKQATSQATLRAAVTGCAVERHRLAHGGRLPESLAELVPRFLPAVPADPFDGQPLRYRHTNDTYVVYSVGADLADDGGLPPPTNSAERLRKGHDVGFRVTDRRR